MKTYKEYLVSEADVRKKTIISFSIFFVLLAGAVFAWIWLQKQPQDNGALKPLRTVLNSNEGFFNNFFSNNHLAKAFPLSAAVHHVRVNGDAGMSDNFDASNWKLHWVRKPDDTLLITLEDIKSLPKTDRKSVV